MNFPTACSLLADHEAEAGRKDDNAVATRWWSTWDCSIVGSSCIGLLKWQSGEFVQLKCSQYELGRSPRVLFEAVSVMAQRLAHPRVVIKYCVVFGVLASFDLGLVEYQDSQII